MLSGEGFNLNGQSSPVQIMDCQLCQLSSWIGKIFEEFHPLQGASNCRFARSTGLRKTTVSLAELLRLGDNTPGFCLRVWEICRRVMGMQGGRSQGHR